MARVKLTKNKVDEFQCPEGKAQVFLRDTGAPGLAVRATKGAKAYVFQSKISGSDLRITIGDVKVWNLDAAQAEARRLQTLIDQGVDPRQEKAERLAVAEKKREAARLEEAPALEAWDKYVEARRGKWSKAHLADHLNVSKAGGELRTRGRRPGESDKTQPGALRALLLLPLDQIDANRVRTWLAEESSKRPTHARLAFGLLRAFLNWCGDQEQYKAYANTDACAPRVAKDELPKKRAKDDCLLREQLAVWFQHVQKLSPVQSAYLQCVLLLGPRRNELTALRWEDIDFRWNSLDIRDKAESKGGEDGRRTIPLTPFVRSLLLNLKRINETPPPKHRILNGRKIENDLAAWKPSPWVFFSRTSESGHIEEPRMAHDRAVKAAGLPHLSVHGLRRSFGSLAEWCECPVGVVAQIQGHKPSATAEKHYRVRPLDLLRMWHSKIESWMLEQAGIQLRPASEVGQPALAVA